jgi:hypothetical protein
MTTLSSLAATNRITLRTGPEPRGKFILGHYRPIDDVCAMSAFVPFATKLLNYGRGRKGPHADITALASGRMSGRGSKLRRLNQRRGIVRKIRKLLFRLHKTFVCSLAKRWYDT